VVGCGTGRGLGQDWEGRRLIGIADDEEGVNSPVSNFDREHAVGTAAEIAEDPS
jgi:hypothetical protein